MIKSCHCRNLNHMNFSIGVYDPIHLVGLYTTRLPVFRWKSRGYDWALVDSIKQPSYMICTFPVSFERGPKSNGKLQSVQNAAARIIAGLKKRDHITETLRDLHWLPVEERIVFKINLITFKTLNGSGLRSGP